MIKKIGATGLISLLTSKSTWIFIALLIFVLLVANGHSLNWTVATVAALGIMANDSVQAIGIYMVINKQKPWWRSWLFVSVLFCIITLLTFFVFAGEMHYNRLDAIAFPGDLSPMYLLVPILLLLMTQKRIPMSSTFLLLGAFAKTNLVNTMLMVSISSYFLSFIIAALLWHWWLNNKSKYTNITKKIEPLLPHLITISTAVLWTVWLMTNSANVLVFLPRVFDSRDLLVYMVVILVVLAIVFKHQGGPVFKMVNEKKSIKESALAINLCYAIIAYSLKYCSSVPVATSFVFVGILGGREITIAYDNLGNSILAARGYRYALKIIARDLFLSGSGVLVSLVFVKFLHFLGV